MTRLKAQSDDIKSIRFNDLETDYKAETIAKNLIHNKLKINQIFTKRLSSDNRSFNKDVYSINISHFDFEDDVVVIEHFKDGIYDYLPEGIMHKPNLGNMKNGIENIVLEIRKQKEAEENARTFFQPFEMESFYALLETSMEEDRYDCGANDNTYIDILSTLWPLLHSLERSTAKVFIALLPTFHLARGNKTWFEKCMRAFLGLPVNITFQQNVVDGIEHDDSLLLSNMQLGINSILNGKHEDGERNWIVNIGPIPYSEIKNYLPGSALRKLLKDIYSYCLPVTSSVYEHFITEKETTSFLLQPGQGKENILGYSTFL